MSAQPNETAIKSPEETQALAIADKWNNIEIIKDRMDRVIAEDEVATLKNLEDKIFAYLDEPRAKAYEDYKYHKKRLDDAIMPVQEARKQIKAKCIEYDQEQERIRLAEERRLQVIADKQAEDEALAAAQAAIDEGEPEIAEAILETPVVAPTVTVQRTEPAPSRLTATRTYYSGDVINLMALVKAVADGKIDMGFLQANQQEIDGAARRQKELFKLPGVRLVKELR